MVLGCGGVAATSDAVFPGPGACVREMESSARVSATSSSGLAGDRSLFMAMVELTVGLKGGLMRLVVSMVSDVMVSKQEQLVINKISLN